MDDTDRQGALRILRETMTDPDAKHADKVRAAQLLLEHEATGRKGAGALHDATDAELLAIARGARAGEGGTPPERGPTGLRTGAVPSSSTEEAPGNSQGAEPEKDALGRVPAAFLVRGPKKEPPNSPTPPPNSQMGPKKELLFAGGPEIGDARDLEPWE